MRVTSPKWGAPLVVVSLLWLFLSLPFGRRLRDIFEWYFVHGGWRLTVTTACDRRTRRLRLPSYFWRGITLVTLIVLVADDPSWDYAFGQCAPPASSNIVDNFALTRVTSYTYDFDGRLTQMNSPEGYINYGYDAATGRLLSTCTTNSYITNSYDALGRLKTVTALKRNGTNLLSPETTTYLYDGVGNRQEIDLPNGIKTTYLYDSLNRLTNLTHKTGSAIDAVYSYKLDATGRRTNAVEIVLEEGVGGYLTNTLTWQYDGMYRLTNEVSLCSSNAYSYTNQYVYSLAGNRLTKTAIAGNTLVTTNLYDANDELLREVTKTGPNYTETNNYAYDANGSMIGRTNLAAGGLSTNVYAYNLMNKLSSVTSGATVTGFQYNDQGIRVRVTGASPKYYLIDANNHTGYQQVLEEFTSLGSAPSRSYVIGDDVLAQADSGSASYLLYDGHGSTRQVADNSGGVSSRYNYDAYGVTQSGTTTLNPNPNTSLKYCGEQYDSALGMYNLRARYYNPANGTFNGRDSHKGNIYDPQSLHRYLYANGDPINGKDPSGHETLVGVMIAVTVAICLEVLYDATLVAATAHSIRSFEQSLFPLVHISAGQVPAFHKDLAHLCKDSYYSPARGWGQWQPATPQELADRGLQNAVFQSGAFSSQLYRNGNDYVLAYRGTDNLPDWYSNIGQGALGPLLRTQYQEATALADQVNDAVGDASLTITGHSLGGGLASAAAFETDRPCVTFNAAALNELSYFYYGGPWYDSDMVNYSIKGEILTTAQRGAFGIAPPTSFCRQYQLDPAQQDANASAITLHSMGVVLNALGEPVN